MEKTKENTEVKKDEREYIDLKEERAIIMLPEDSVEIEISATIYKDGELCYVSKCLNNKELHKAFCDAEENYIDPTDMFELVEHN